MTSQTSVDNRRLALERELTMVRDRTMTMIDPLTEEDLEKQHLEIMSPLVWDVGHVGNFEELWLLRTLDGRDPHDAGLDNVYNPFENPRWCRGDLDFLRRAEAVEYLGEIRGEALDLLRTRAWDPEDGLLANGYVFDMVVQHEAQHQETILQALDLRYDLDPYPIFRRRVGTSRSVNDADRVLVPAATFVMGTDDRLSAYDNERPAHPVDVPAFEIDRFPLTARRFGEFVSAGGYRQREWWSDVGWDWLQESGFEAPQGWIPDVSGGWTVRRFGHVIPLDPTEPVQHVSFHEAEAYANWAGGRLPTEAEWEKAAVWDPITSTSRKYPWGDAEPTQRLANLDHSSWGPVPVGSLPEGASSLGVEQMIGDVYEWTSSKFHPYEGYTTFPYPEYSEVFFGDDYTVLRGSSWATSPLVGRATFRNWDYPIRRQIFAGFRMAWDVGESN